MMASLFSTKVDVSNPLHLVICLGGVVVPFIVQVLHVYTKNYSWVDRLWSIVPAVYTWIYVAGARHSEEPDVRALVVACCITLWGARLTFNFWRRGGYNPTDQDIRWTILQKHIVGVLWSLFAIVFIAYFQLHLLAAITFPVYYAMQYPSPWNAMDSGILVLFVCALAVETAADNQQYSFQTEKYRLLALARKAHPTKSDIELLETLPKPYRYGFRTTGLFKYSRHPNFICELLIWFCVYAFSVSASGERLNWSIGGWIVLVALFQGSTAFTEKISSEKYPLYKVYQATTGMLVPFPPFGRFEKTVRELDSKVQ
ncbi:hypothetical protein HDU85_005635 [Gaertneriomyces sp. JEL0708]|nr:hypothetical protein HDU85_005635 [Gaertneriomyces sp. JEL0708]